MNCFLKYWMLVVLLSGFLTAIPDDGAAQKPQTSDGPHQISLVLQGKPLDFALQQLVQQTGIDLIYDPGIMTDHFVYLAAKEKVPEEILRLMLKGSGLDFIQLSSGTYVLVEAPQQPLSRGDLSGLVVDKSTGEPLAGAHVMLADAATGTATNASGFFNIAQLKTGPYEVTVTYVGYKPVKDTVWIPAGSTSTRRFSLASKPVLVEPVVISGIQKKLPAAAAFVDKAEKPRYSALGSVDAVKSLNTIMGINFNLPMADFNIQGGDPGEHKLQLDGVPVYNPVSMGRLIGAFSPYAIGNITVHKAGYGSPVGSQLSGVINVQQDISHSNGRNLLIQADPVNINGRYDYHFRTEDRPSLHLMVAGRTNLWRWYQKPGLSETLRNWDRIDPLLTNSLIGSDTTRMNYYQEDHTSDIRYYDLHLAAAVEHDSFHRTTISAYRGRNYLETNLFSKNVNWKSSEPQFMYTIDRYHWTNTMGKIAHEWLINSRLDAGISGYFTQHRLNHNYSMGNDLETNLNGAESFALADQLRLHTIHNMQTGDQNNITEAAARLKLNASIHKNYQLKTGLKATYLDNSFHLSEKFYRSARSSSNRFMVSGFVQNNIHLNHKTSLSAGSRMTFVPSRDLFFAEPRLSVQHEIPETTAGYISTKISGGIYRQFINQFDVTSVGPSALVPSIRFWTPVDYSTRVPKAYHLAGHVLWEPGRNWKFKLESYYKWLPVTLALDYQKLLHPATLAFSALEAQNQFITHSQQYSHGIGLLVEKSFLNPGLKISGNYQSSMAKQRTPGRFGGRYEPVPWNQPHQLNFSVEWQAFFDFLLMLQWQNIWGRSWGFRKAYYDYLSVTNVDDFGAYSFDNPSGDRLPSFSQLDAGMSYKMELGEAELHLRMNLFNILNRKNILNWWLSPYEEEHGALTYRIQKRTLPGFSPSFGLKLSY